MLDEDDAREAVLAYMAKTGTSAKEIAKIVHLEISAEEVGLYLANEPLGDRSALVHRIMCQFGATMDEIEQDHDNDLA